MSAAPRSLELVEADWAVPPHVRAIMTTRRGGVSEPPYETLNLAQHVGDAPRAVEVNRRRLREALDLALEPCWLRQVHGVNVVTAGGYREPPVADASVSREPHRVCAVLTADCLPVLLCSRDGACVAAVHAGWRGLAAGIIEAALENMGAAARDVRAWLGPAIGAAAYEVGDDVRSRFTDARDATAFARHDDNRWCADLQTLASLRLRDAGVEHVSRSRLCTYADSARFFSYRRDGVCGRMAAVIWMTG
ncbi:purine nucleoside phosphorylase YfiH [soil metagenome]